MTEHTELHKNFRHCKAKYFAVIGLVFLGWGSLNTSGFCFNEMRYIPDQEFFARYLESTQILLRPDIIQVRGRVNDPNVKSFVSFDNGFDYLQRHPDCCSYGPQMGVIAESDQSPRFYQRFLGSVWGLVAIHYHLEYVNGQGQPSEYQQFIQSWINSCGNVVRSY